METKVKMDLNYYAFLGIVQEISRNSNSIQKSLIKKVYENYDLSQVKSILDREIEILNRLIIKKH